MTDRELLELAARATGLHIKAERVDVDDSFTHFVIGEKNTRERTNWNPLADDGDALRLAVKCGISIDIVWDGENDQYDPVIANYNGGRARFEEQMGLGFDNMAATRLAIVRAAAEIGKAMP